MPQQKTNLDTPGSFPIFIKFHPKLLQNQHFTAKYTFYSFLLAWIQFIENSLFFMKAMQRNKSRLHRNCKKKFNPRPKPALLLLYLSCSAFFPRFYLKFSIMQPTCFFISFSEFSVGDVFANCFFGMFFPLICCFLLVCFFLTVVVFWLIFLLILC